MHMMVQWHRDNLRGWRSMCNAPWIRVLTIFNVTWNITEVTCPACLAEMGHADFGDQNKVKSVSVERPVCGRCDDPIYGPGFESPVGTVCYECNDDLGG